MGRLVPSIAFNFPTICCLSSQGVVVPGGTIGEANVTANRVYYWPFTLDTVFSATKMKIRNGATVAGNVEMGIYSHIGAVITKLIGTGAVALSGTNQEQVIALTATTALPAGRYFMAIVYSNGTSTPKHLTSGLGEREGWLSGIYREESASLPATATPAAPVNADYIPMVSVMSETL